MKIIRSILDNDIYKFTMGQAVNQKFPNAWAKYKFINRGGTKFTESEHAEIALNIDRLSDLWLTENEFEWLKGTCPYLSPVYLDFLREYSYDQNEIKITLDKETGELSVEIEGPWYRTIYWEVPVMAIISEVYNRTSKQPKGIDLLVANEKAKILGREGCKFADFGTRRRFSALHHKNVVKELKKWRSPFDGGFIGTSNVSLAHRLGVKPIGTQAHEWIMFHGAQYGYCPANYLALQNWREVYGNQLSIALSDTYGSDDFFESFTKNYSQQFDGVRHDSGDPYGFAEKAIAHYKKHKIDPKTKTIVFSDGLNVDKIVEIQKAYGHMINCSYGIGTNLTNDIVDGADPLNIVIKMTHCKERPEDPWTKVVKLSDEPGKHTGDPKEIEHCKRAVNYAI